jgi:hypothetical protein
MAGRHRGDGLVFLAILAGSLLLVGLHVHRYTATSPIDELSHIDTLIKTSRFHLVRGDERVGQAAMREQACRGISRDDKLPPCDTAVFDPKQFPDYGVNVISTRFPVYHALTGLPARVMASLPGVDIVGAARFLGAVWLAAGLFLTWLLMRLLEIPVAARLAVLPLMATTPVVLHAQSIVNSDATLLFGGAAVGYMAVRWEQGAIPTWLLVTTAVLGVALETTTLLAVALWAVYLMVRGAFRPARRRRGVDGSPEPAAWRKSAVGLALLAGGLSVFVALPIAHRLLIGSANPIVSPVTPDEAAGQHQATEVAYGPVPRGRIAGEITGLVTPVKRPYIPPVLAGATAEILVSVTDWLLIAAVFGGAALCLRRSQTEALAVAAIAVMLAAGPLHAVWNARRDVFFAIPTRFGMPILPVLFALLAQGLQKRTVLAIVGLASFLSVAVTVGHLL